MFVQLLEQLPVQLLAAVLKVLPQIVQPFDALQLPVRGFDRRHQQLGRVQVVFLCQESGQLCRHLPYLGDLVQHLQHVLVLDRIGVELLQLVPAAAQQLFAGLEVFLHHLYPLPGGRNFRRHLAEQLHDTHYLILQQPAYARGCGATAKVNSPAFCPPSPAIDVAPGGAGCSAPRPCMPPPISAAPPVLPMQ
uniref:Uncharacterized protein n=1 Tax=Anopheles merus TaxID=30066 RepID=A0A182UPT7_ANOME